MPQEHKSRREVLDAIQRLPPMAELLEQQDGHYQYEVDLEVVVYGRNYGGKKVGPYVRLLTYKSGEQIIRQGEWGGNTFYFVVEGQVEVVVETAASVDTIVKVLPQGSLFGEMSVLAGVPRNATVRVPQDQPARILEVHRAALRLLRKLARFGESIDKSLRSHGRDTFLEHLKEKTSLDPGLLDILRAIGKFRIFAKNHLLFSEHELITSIFIIKDGWLQRSSKPPSSSPSIMAEDFLGEGYCFGLDAALRETKWEYSVTLLSRSEVFEIPVAKLRQSTALRIAVGKHLGCFAPPPLKGKLKAYPPTARDLVHASQQQLISTGVIEGSNLLVMDMDLCVRCGNCSLACHKVHGHSRLLRRGIHARRLLQPRLYTIERESQIQSVLAPAVCMHCQDPECLTGCPTGAIGRFANGEIDIDPKTCIGCGDCAAQCPYDAISLVPRKAPLAASPAKRLQTLRELFRISLDPLPAAVGQIDELVAVKCNLCNNTSLNPEGSRRRAYSCEENCPTGALARINPKSYFEEVGELQGLLYLDQTHAVARNIHKSDPPKHWMHVIGSALTILCTILTLIGLARYGLAERIVGFLNMRWITGLVGLLGIVGVMAYPVRRQIYKKRAGPLRYWMLAHSYLGVVAGVMILLHAGTESGGVLTTALTLSFDAVILTGLVGIAFYGWLPRILTSIEGTPLLLDDLVSRRLELLKELQKLSTVSGPLLQRSLRERVVSNFLSLRYVLRNYWRRESLESLLKSARAEARDGVPQLGEPERKQLDQSIEAAVTISRLTALIYLHRLLKGWLPVHVVVTALMLALMLVHILQVVYY